MQHERKGIKEIRGICSWLLGNLALKEEPDWWLSLEGASGGTVVMLLAGGYTGAGV